MSESDILARIRRQAQDTIDPRVKFGIGDDAAVWQPSRSHRSVISTDTLVDGVHFRLERIGPEALGHKALAVNLSDLAAMGARPVLAVAALAMPEPDAGWTEALYRGMCDLARRTGTNIVGGDLSVSPVTAITVTVVGEASPTRIPLRSAARPGDILAVTGPLGASAAGLQFLERGFAPSTDGVEEAAVRAHHRPEPRLREGRFLAASRAVHALMDLSDGIAADARKLAAAAGCGITVTSIPIAKCAQALGERLHISPLELAAAGGEDYELLAAIAPRGFETVRRAYQARFGKDLLRVGVCEAGAGMRFVGLDLPETLSGFDHFQTA